MNPYYNYSGAFIPGTLARAETETAEFQSVQQGFNLLSNSGLDTGVVNALVVTTPYAPTALTDGATVIVKVKATNTAAATLAANGLPATNILRGTGGALQAADLTANVWTTFTYDSSFAAWLLSAPAAFTATSGVTVIASGPPVNKVGLVAAGGVSLQVVPIDATYAIDQSIAPTWTGDHTFTPGSGVAVTINAKANSYGMVINGSATSGQSLGLRIFGGTISTDAALAVTNQANTAIFLELFGDGHGTLGPSSSLGLRWSTAGGVTIPAPSSGVALAVTGLAGQAGVQLQTAPLSVTNNALPALQINSSGSNYGVIGNVSANLWALGTNAAINAAFTAALSWNSTGNITIAAPSSGTTVSISAAATSTALLINTNGGGSGDLLLSGSVPKIRLQDSGVSGSIIELIAINGAAIVNSNWTTTATPMSLRINSTEAIGVSTARNVTIGTPSSGNSLVVNQVSAAVGVYVQAPAAGVPNVQLRDANGYDWGMQLNAATGAWQLNYIQGALIPLSVTRNGNVSIPAPTSGIALTITPVASSGYGLAVTSGAGVPGNLGLAGNGNAIGTADFLIQQDSSSNAVLFNRANAAMILATNGTNRVSIAAAGAVTINAPASGNTALLINGIANSNTAQVNASSTSGQSFGLVVNAGTTSADYALLIVNQASSLTFLKIFGDGHGTFGPSGSLGLSWTATGDYTLATPTSGVALTINGINSTTTDVVVVSNPSGGTRMTVGSGLTTVGAAIWLSGAASALNWAMGASVLVAGAFEIIPGTANGNTTLAASAVFQVLGTTAPTLKGYGPTAAGLVDMTPDKGTFTITYTGFTGATSGTATWTRVGNLVLLTFPAATNVSNAVTWTGTGLPAAIQPASLASEVVLLAEDNGTIGGGVFTATVAFAVGSGTVTFKKNGLASSWTNVGTKGTPNAVTVAYSIQ